MTRAIAETCYGDLRSLIKIVKWVQSFEKAWVEIRTTLGWMDGSLCGATIRASLFDANKLRKTRREINRHGQM